MSLWIPYPNAYVWFDHWIERFGQYFSARGEVFLEHKRRTIVLFIWWFWQKLFGINTIWSVLKSTMRATVENVPNWINCCVWLANITWPSHALSARDLERELISQSWLLALLLGIHYRGGSLVQSRGLEDQKQHKVVARGSMPYLNNQTFGCLLRTGSKVKHCLATFISIQNSRISVQPDQGKKLRNDFALNLPQTLLINESYQSYSR